jgi:hypothetical protein
VEAVLKYNLPEEKEEYEMAVHGIDYYLCLDDMREWLRQKLKYDAEGLDVDTLEKVQERFFEIIGERNVDL